MLQYFAYGSNLNRARLLMRIGKHKELGNYTLKDHRLVFDTGNGWCSFANILPHKGREVEGILFLIDATQESYLDEYESVALGMYKKEYIFCNGIKTLVYIGAHPCIESPDEYYLNIIIEGCKDHGLEKTRRDLNNLMKNLYPQSKYIF